MRFSLLLNSFLLMLFSFWERFTLAIADWVLGLSNCGWSESWGSELNSFIAAWNLALLGWVRVILNPKILGVCLITDSCGDRGLSEVFVNFFEFFWTTCNPLFGQSLSLYLCENFVCWYCEMAVRSYTQNFSLGLLDKCILSIWSKDVIWLCYHLKMQVTRI